MQNSREIKFEADLSADFWASHMTAASQGEGEAQSIAKRILASTQALQLVFAQTAVVCNATIYLAAKRQARVEVVQQRETPRVDMAARGLNSKNTCACVAGE